MIEIKGKSLILTDIHFSRKNFRFGYFQNTMLFYDELFDKYFKSKKIKNLFILGDLFDNRVIIDWRIFNAVNELFFQKLEDYGVNIFIILGNHDLYYKNSLEEHSLKYLPKMFKNITVFEKDTFIDFNDKKLLFVPWIIDNKISKETLDSVKKSDLVLGHFELNGFEVIHGIKANNSLDIKVFKNKRILSGHYHIKNLPYLGTSEQMNWGDFGDARGCHILNEDLSLDFIENKVSQKFIKVFINSKEEKPITISGFYKRDKKFKKFSEFYDDSKIFHKYRIIVKDNSNVKVYNNAKVDIDSTKINYSTSYETEEILKHLSTNKISGEKLDLHEMVKENIESDEVYTVFSELYQEATRMIED